MTNDPTERPEPQGSGRARSGGRYPVARRKLHHYWRQIWMLTMSLLIIGIVLTVSFQRGQEIFCPRGPGLVEARERSTWELCPRDEGEVTPEDAAARQVPPAPLWWPPLLAAPGDPRWGFLAPYLTNLAGVLLFILSVARSKGRKWSFEDYLGAHAFRIAQSMAYLFIVLWAWPSVGSQEVVTARLGPHLLGFLVGLYIIRMERVMASFGERLEDILSTALPQSLDYEPPGARARRRLRTTVKLDDVVTQWEALRPQVDHPGARERIDELIAEVQKAGRAGEQEKAQALASQLFGYFEEIKRTAGEVLVPIEDLLRR